MRRRARPGCVEPAARRCCSAEARAYDGTDGETPDRYKDAAPHYARTVPTIGSSPADPRHEVIALRALSLFIHLFLLFTILMPLQPAARTCRRDCHVS